MSGELSEHCPAVALLVHHIYLVSTATCAEKTLQIVWSVEAMIRAWATGIGTAEEPARNAVSVVPHQAC